MKFRHALNVTIALVLTACGPSVTVEDAADAAALNRLARQHYQNEQYDKAVELFDRAEELDPTNAQYPNDRGMARLRQGKPLLAAVDFKRAMNIDPKQAMYPYNRGLAYVQAGKRQQAVAAFERAIELNPNYYDPPAYLGLLNYNEQDYKNARKYWEQAVKIHDNAELRTNLGTLAIAMEHPINAEAHLLEAIALDPEFALAYYNLGVLRQSQEKYAAAESNYRKALELDPANVRPYLNLGIVLTQLDRKDEAVQNFETFIRKAPPRQYMQQIIDARARINKLQSDES